jgi:uncharacterized coiled-coil DUF342 family protein
VQALHEDAMSSCSASADELRLRAQRAAQQSADYKALARQQEAQIQQLQDRLAGLRVEEQEVLPAKVCRFDQRTVCVLVCCV